ncbi:quinol:electron acceptor oxidoreductase subunit ActD [Allorhodopirellula heiligendammensis]|uniref:Cytochrome c n=1 Tax=Allorhodopirellula heiligendammensis TaxID=2714739 RepID=A0A5C6BUC4_9BACT|nr:quinol:electron acceptor oxidoreductase subunit ActD [Allorhodopirellula heiligendammensis]TWU15442.1 Cytochrome c [Allorhodopirellula heiligendammensis]
MSKPKTSPKAVDDDNVVRGVVAEFTDVSALLAACERVRDAGYTKADAFAPFAVHGIDKALGIKPTVLPWISLAAGGVGTCTALAMQAWMNGVNYQYIISGKPFISLPASIPVAFELTILFASFATFLGMWALNGLPKFSNPMFTSPRFDRVTDDTFFLFLDAKDSRFEEAGAKSFLSELGGEYIETVREDDSPKAIPKFLLVGIAVLIAFSLIPALLVARMRVTKSTAPRFHIFPDMDFSPAKDMQQTSTLFADGRAMRPDVPGTVNRGEMDWNLDFQTGIDLEKLSQIDAPRARQLVAMMQSDAAVDEGDDVAEADDPEEPQSEDNSSEPPTADASDADSQPATDAAPADNVTAEKDTAEKDTADQPAGEPSGDEQPHSLAPASGPSVDTTPWLTENPVELTDAMLRRGQTAFGVYCSVCHGMDGNGNGLVNQRAQLILATTWTPPSNLHDQTLFQDAYPDGKLFSTISNGIRKMPGYRAQIGAEDRWAIVAYVRALQASQDATLEDVPQSRRAAIEKQQAEVKAAIEKAAAEAEAKAKADAPQT